MHGDWGGDFGMGLDAAIGKNVAGDYAKAVKLLPEVAYAFTFE